MPNLAQLTDAYYNDTPASLPVEPLYQPTKEDAITIRPVTEAAPAGIFDNVGMAGVEDKTGASEHPLLKQLFGLGGETRYQLWPERVLREGLTKAGEIMEKGTNLGLRREDVTDIPAPDMPTKDSTWLGKKLGIAPVAASPQDDIIEAAQAISALAGSGGLGGTGGNVGTTLGIVPVDIAKKLNFKTGQTSNIIKEAVANTPAASIDADGHLIVNMVRHQMTDQAGAESIRGGVFYLPEGSPNARHYNGTTNNNYGGQQRIEGQTAYKNPLVVKGATGGKAPEMAYNEIMSDKKAYSNLDKDVMEVVTASNWMKKKDPKAFSDLINRFLDTHAPEMNGYADYIIDNSTKGNQLRYALSEAAIASAARKAGYDGIVGYSIGRGVNKGKPFLSEIFDTRENLYPSPSGDYSVHPELYSDSKIGTTVQAVARSGPFLRPALKYKDKLYKGKEGQQHLDVIPESLYPTFQKQAMSGEDISNFNFGFINDKGQFLNREKALEYGINTGLIDPQAGKFGALTSTLMADSSKPGIAIEAMAKTGPYKTDAFHGTQEFKSDKVNYYERSDSKPFYSAANPELSNQFSQRLYNEHLKNPEGAQTLPLKLDTSNYHTIDAKGAGWDRVNLQAIQEARAKGFKGVVIKNVIETNEGPMAGKPQDIFITLDPTTVRSRFAKFNPEDFGKNGLLLADSSKPGAAIQANKAPTGYQLIPVQGNPFDASNQK